MEKRKTTDLSFFETENNTSLKTNENSEHLSIPKGIKSIYCAFEKMQNLRSIIIPTSVENIWPNFIAFDYCPNLKSENFISYSPVLFRWWVKNHQYADKTLNTIKEIDLSKYTNSNGNHFTKIDSGAFQYSLLQSIVTGSFITEIRSFSFVKCHNLKHVEIDKNVQSIGKRIFVDCPKLKSENVISCSPVLFDWWVENHKYNGETLSRMTTIDLDKYVNSDGKLFASISMNALDNCVNVKNILFGDSIKQINAQCLRLCNNLKNIQITNKNILLKPRAFEHILRTTNFYVRDRHIKNKLRKIGIDSKQIFVKPIPINELEETKETKVELAY